MLDIVQDLMIREGVDAAVTDATIQSIPHIRSRRVHAIVEACDTLGQESVTRSWQMTGIPNALWGESHKTVYEGYEEALRVTGALPVREELIAQNHKEEDRPNAIVATAESSASRRGRPKLSEEERAKRARSQQEKEQEQQRYKALPLAMRRLADSAKGTSKITSFFRKPNGDNSQ